MSMQEKANTSGKRWAGPEVPLLLLLTSALTVVKNKSVASAGRRDLKRAVLSVRVTLRTKFLLISLLVAALPFLLSCWCLWQKQPAASVLATRPVRLECGVSCGLSNDSHCTKIPLLFPLYPSLLATLSASSAGESREAASKSWGFDLRGSVLLSAWARGHWVRSSRADLGQGAHASLFEEFVTAKDSERGLVSARCGAVCGL